MGESALAPLGSALAVRNRNANLIYVKACRAGFADIKEIRQEIRSRIFLCLMARLPHIFIGQNC